MFRRRRIVKAFLLFAEVRASFSVAANRNAQLRRTAKVFEPGHMLFHDFIITRSPY